jgi:formate dehydrogenase subunit gamma
MMERVRKYSQLAVVFHWAHTAAFILLLLTGLFLYVPALSFLAEGGWSRLIHRIASFIFVAAPLYYIIVNPQHALMEIKRAFFVSKDDFKWLIAAPKYYFLGDESAMPPQEEMNTGQRMWLIIVIVTGLLFVLTGALMWFFRGFIPSEAFQISVFFHDVAFILVFLMFFVHIYLGVLHPLMRQHGGSFQSMIDGTITSDYARSHHGKWYNRIMKRTGQ